MVSWADGVVGWWCSCGAGRLGSWCCATTSLLAQVPTAFSFRFLQLVAAPVFQVPELLHFEPSLDALRLRSDVISSTQNLPSSPFLAFPELIDSPLWEGHLESRRCSRDTHPESYITKCTRIRRKSPEPSTLKIKPKSPPTASCQPARLNHLHLLRADWPISSLGGV